MGAEDYAVPDSPRPLPSRTPHGPEYSGTVSLCLLSMLNHVALTGGRITVSLTALTLGSSTLQVGMLVAVFAILPMLASVHTGRWVDKIGVMRPLAIGTGLTCIGTFLPFAWQSQTALLVAACCIGIGFMLHQVATQDILGHATQDRRLRNFSILSLALAASGFSGPLIAGLAIDHLGSRLAFGLLALCPLLSVGGLYLMRHPLREFSTALVASHRVPDTRPKLGEILAVPALRRVMLVNTILSGAWDTHLFVVPIYGIRIGLSATTIGLILAAFSAATFIIRIFLPIIQRRVRGWTMVRVAMVTAATDFMIYPLFEDVSVLIGLSFVLGLALGACQPSVLALVHQFSPPGRAAEAMGLRLALVNCSQVSLPLTFGALGALIGVAPLFWAYAAALALGGWFNRHPPQESADPPP